MACCMQVRGDDSDTVQDGSRWEAQPHYAGRSGSRNHRKSGLWFHIWVAGRVTCTYIKATTSVFLGQIKMCPSNQYSIIH